MSITSEEQKIIDLENENSFLKDNLYEEQEQNEYLKDKVDNQQKEIEEKSTIIMAGAEKVKQLEKEIILLKIEKLKALKQYKECHLSQIPDTANIYYSMKLELEAIDEEISNLMRIWENY